MAALAVYRMEHSNKREAWEDFFNRTGRLKLDFQAPILLQFRSIETAEESGSFRLPFDQVDGVHENRKSKKLLFWGDDGCIAAYDFSRAIKK